MSKENVEIVRLLYEAVNRGDLDVVLEFLDPSIHLDFSERVFNPAIYEGHDGARRFYAELDEVWDDFRTEPVEFIEAGDRVVVLHRIQGVGKVSGVEVELPSTSIYSVSGGKVVAIRMYREHRDALEAAGLRDAGC
jgi:ketosteroid isomerase-like protein